MNSFWVRYNNCRLSVVHYEFHFAVIELRHRVKANEKASWKFATNFYCSRNLKGESEKDSRSEDSFWVSCE